MKPIQEFQEARQVLTLNALDIGCSYSINVVPMKCNANIIESYERYCDLNSHTQDHSTLPTRDRQLVHARNRLKCTRFVSLDISRSSLSYALLAGFLDSAVHADLEERDLTERQREQFAGTDLFISASRLGYVSNKTISRVASTSEEHKP
jgi:hypothetical protein